MLHLEGKYCKDCLVMNDEVETSALATIYDILGNKAFENSKIRIMPDVHDGKGIVIGFTSPLGELVNPAHVGVDIGCMVSLYITDTEINEKEFPLIEHRIKKEIPFGTNYYSNRQFEMKEFLRYIRKYYNTQLASAPEYLNHVNIDEEYLSKMMKRIRMDEGVFYKSIGTVGSSNHFIEINNFNGKYAFSIHCGSRNFGAKIGNYWISISEKGKINEKEIKSEIKKIVETTENKEEIPNLIKELKENAEHKLHKGYLEGDLLKDYLTDMVIASAYARFNHEIISRKIINILHNINGAVIMDEIHSVHNYIDFEDKMIRKGAIRAHLNERILIPLNMKDGICIAYGLGNEEWNCSCSHGAGRKMSRSQAKAILSMDDFKKEMTNVYSTTVCENTLDESPMAYKDSETIINLISDTCNIINVAKPLINIKSTDIEEYFKK